MPKNVASQSKPVVAYKDGEEDELLLKYNRERTLAAKEMVNITLTIGKLLKTLKHINDDVINKYKKSFDTTDLPKCSKTSQDTGKSTQKLPVANSSKGKKKQVANLKQRKYTKTTSLKTSNLKVAPKQRSSKHLKPKGKKVNFKIPTSKKELQVKVKKRHGSTISSNPMPKSSGNRKRR